MSTGNVYKDVYLNAALGDNHSSLFPSTVYIALFSSAPTDAGGGTELLGNGYVRAAVPNTTENWPVANEAVKTNGRPITFQAATDDWATAIHFAIMDAHVGGNIIHHGPLESPLDVQNGFQAVFAPGSLSITAECQE